MEETGNAIHYIPCSGKWHHIGAISIQSSSVQCPSTAWNQMEK
jgi:hypothetical protein